MTTSIIDLEEIKKLLPADSAAELAASFPAEPFGKSVSIQDLIDRAKGLFTPEEAEALGRRIEESCEQMDD